MPMDTRTPPQQAFDAFTTALKQHYGNVYQVVTIRGTEGINESEEFFYCAEPAVALHRALTDLAAQADSTYLLFGEERITERIAIALKDVNASSLAFECECVFAYFDSPEDSAAWTRLELEYRRQRCNTEVKVYRLTIAEFLEIVAGPFREIIES